MGERKGVNKYYPPDYDPSKGGLNKFQGTHALRERARKLHLGILIIRFEMPYNIWCDGCENHIGTGVRYNAEKKKVGMYYSTPIYQFRMKCHLCDNHFEIKTDPANLDYEIISGARRQERRWDPTENEQVVPEDKEVTRKMAIDAMFKLEHGVGDKAKSKEAQQSLEQLEEFQTRRWHDDYGSNRAMRDSMRAKRFKDEDQAVRDASYNLSVPLLPPSEEDSKTAKLLQLTQSKTSDELHREKIGVIDAQSVFAKFKPKRISPLEKKKYARNSIEGIVSHSQMNFSNFKSPRKHQNLGVVIKKKDEETNKLPISTTKVYNDEDTNKNVASLSSEGSSRNFCLSTVNQNGNWDCENGNVSTYKKCEEIIEDELKEELGRSSSSDHPTKIMDNLKSLSSSNTSSSVANKTRSLVCYDYSGSDSDC